MEIRGAVFSGGLGPSPGSGGDVRPRRGAPRADSEDFVIWRRDERARAYVMVAARARGNHRSPNVETVMTDSHIERWWSVGARGDAQIGALNRRMTSEKSKRDRRFMSPKVVPPSGAMPSGERAFTFWAPHFGIPTTSRRR